MYNDLFQVFWKSQSVYEGLRKLLMQIRNFCEILFLRIALNTYLHGRPRISTTYISKQQSDLAFLLGFHFHETPLVRCFAKITPSRRFPN